MLALGEGVSVAPVGRAVLASGRHTHRAEPVPGSSRVTTTTTEAAAIAAGQQILVGQTVLVLAVRGNAQTVRSSLGSAEGPAGTADGLVANLLQRGALRPLLGGVELGGQVVENLDLLHGQLLSSLQGTEELSVVTSGNGLVGKPSGVLGIDVLGDFHESGRMGEGQRKNGKQKECSHIAYGKKKSGFEFLAKAFRRTNFFSFPMRHSIRNRVTASFVPNSVPARVIP